MEANLQRCGTVNLRKGYKRFVAESEIPRLIGTTRLGHLHSLDARGTRITCGELASVRGFRSTNRRANVITLLDQAPGRGMGGHEGLGEKEQKVARE